MSAGLIILLVVVLLFGFVLAFGAPYLPTLRSQTETALDLLDLKPGQTLLELGSGDGRILKAAAKRGIYATGYELNPILLLWSWLATRRQRKFIKIKLANFWRVKLPKTDGVYVFLLAKYMEKLDNKIAQEINNNVKLVSFGFEIPSKQPIQEKDGLFLYKYDSR